VTTPSEFEAFGKPVPAFRRDNAYSWLKSTGVERSAAWSTVEAMAQHIERDHPHEARERALQTVDLTGAYRLLAVLVTGEPPCAACDGAGCSSCSRSPEA
jgi:hypothetical protein